MAALAATMAVGMLLRLAPGIVPLFAGTIVAGLGIALGNVLVPSLIKRDFPRHVGAMTGGYTMAISGSGAVAAALAVPAETRSATGGHRSRSGRSRRSSPPRSGSRSSPSTRAPRTCRCLAVAQPPRLAGDDVHGPAVAALLQLPVVAAGAAAFGGHRPRGGRRAAVGDAADRDPHLPARAGVGEPPEGPARRDRDHARRLRGRAHRAARRPGRRARPVGDVCSASPRARCSRCRT